MKPKYRRKLIDIIVQTAEITAFWRPNNMEKTCILRKNIRFLFDIALCINSILIHYKKTEIRR